MNFLALSLKMRLSRGMVRDAKMNADRKVDGWYRLGESLEIAEREDIETAQKLELLGRMTGMLLPAMGIMLEASTGSIKHAGIILDETLEGSRSEAAEELRAAVGRLLVRAESLEAYLPPVVTMFDRVSVAIAQRGLPPDTSDTRVHIYDAMNEQTTFHAQVDETDTYYKRYLGRL